MRIRGADGDRVVSAKKRKTAAASKRRVASKKGAAREKRPHTTGAVAANLHEGSRSEIIADYFDAMREDGHPIPEPGWFAVQISVPVPEAGVAPR